MKSLMRWDPFRMASRWDPLDELRSMQHEMDRIFDRFRGVEAADTRLGTWIPAVESYSAEGKLVFKVDLPGIDLKDLDVSIRDRELVIKGTRKEEKDAKEENYVCREISYGSFERHFLLPEGVNTEELKAKYANGLLEVTVPAPTIAKVRKVEIEASKEEKKTIDAEVKKAA